MNETKCLLLLCLGQVTTHREREEQTHLLFLFRMSPNLYSNTHPKFHGLLLGRDVGEKQLLQAVQEATVVKAFEKRKETGHAELVVIGASQLGIKSLFVADAHQRHIRARDSPEPEHPVQHLFHSLHDFFVVQHLEDRIFGERLTRRPWLDPGEGWVGEHPLNVAVLAFKDAVFELHDLLDREITNWCCALAAVEVYVVGHGKRFQWFWCRLKYTIGKKIIEISLKN